MWEYKVDYFYPLIEDNSDINKIIDKENNTVCVIDVTGFNKDEITLDIEDEFTNSNLQVKAKNKQTKKIMQRTYAIGKKVDIDNITSKLENGILFITLPYKEKQLSVKKSITIT
jgi:HSP20 family molecular chaperone IbpA